MESAERYYCELYGDEDLAELLRFFSENPTKMLRERPHEVLRSSVRHRQMIVVRAEDSDLVVGTAAVFQFLDMQYVELGCMSLSPSVRGQRLQGLLIAMRILQSYLLAARHVFCVVKKYEASTLEPTRSYKNLLRANFREWEQPPDELKATRAELLQYESGAEATYMLYTFSRDNLLTMAQHVNEVVDHPVRRFRSDGHSIEVEIKVPILVDYAKLLITGNA